MFLLLQSIVVVALLLQFDPVHSFPVSVVADSACQSPCIELQCGNFGTTIDTWFKNGDSLNVFTNRFSVSGNSLIINNITVDDEGYYSCINTSNASAVTVDAQLIPLNINTNLTVYPGETFVVECGIKIGSVSPKKKKIRLMLMRGVCNDTNSKLKNEEEDVNWLSPSFTLNYSSYQYDQFFCRVRSLDGNFYANDKKSQYDGPCYHIKYAPEVSIHEAREGCNMTLICNTSHPVVNNSNITVRWLKNGESMSLREHNLTIINTSEKDEATYTCIAEVSGVENSASIQLKAAPCFNGTIKLMDCHTLNVIGAYPHHVVIGNMNSSEDATFNLTISPDDRYLNISYNVSGILGPVKQIILRSFQNCTRETISFNITMSTKVCEESTRDKNCLVEDFFQKLDHHCSDKVCPKLRYINVDLKCDNSSTHKAILSMTIIGPNSLRFLKEYCDQLNNSNTTCSAAPLSPTEIPSPTPSPTEMKPHNERFPLEHVIIVIPLVVLFIAFILLFIIVVIFCLVRVKGRSKSRKISTSNEEHQNEEPEIPLDTLGEGNSVTNVLTHTTPTIVHNQKQDSHPSSLSSCTIDSYNTSHRSIQSGTTRSIHKRNPHCASPHHHHHPPDHMMHDKICKQCYPPTVSCHSCSYHHCCQCYPVCYCSGHYPCHDERPTDFHTLSSRHQGDHYTHPSLIDESQTNHDLQSLTTSHASNDTGHGTQYSHTTFHSQESQKRSKQVTNPSSGFGDYTFNPHKKAGYTTDKSIEQLKKYGLGFRDDAQPVQQLPHSF